MTPELRSEAAAWVARRCSGEPEPGQQRDFLAWLNRSEAHARAYAEAEALWESMRDLEVLAGTELRRARRRVGRQRRRLRWVRLASAALIVAVLVNLSWLITVMWDHQQATYQTALGQRQMVELADGSRLELDTQSTVQIDYSHRRRQIRLLQGQAVFTVAHEARPFEVWAGGTRVLDIGTQFEVRYLDQRLTVVVLDGAVSVTPAGGKTTLLQRGLSVSQDHEGRLQPPQVVDPARSAAWRRGELVFQNQKLRDVLQELARYHRGTVTVSQPLLLETRVSGVVQADDLAQSLRTVAAALPARLSQTSPQQWRLDAR